MKYLLLSIIAILTLSACEGPAGPVGRQGESGNKYDYTTFVYTVNPNDWTHYDNGDGFFYDVSAPEITYDILDYGYFITYINTGTEKEPVYVELPRTLLFTDQNGITYSEEYYPTYSKGLVRIEFFDTHPDTEFLPAREFQFRTVIVSDPYTIRSLQSKKIGTDYNSVMKALENFDIQNNEVKLK